MDQKEPIEAVFDIDLLDQVISGAKTVAARVNVDKYMRPTPYQAKFCNPDVERYAIVRVDRTIKYATFAEYFAMHWRQSMPQCADAKEAHERYLNIEYHKTGAKVFDRDTPVSALVFEVVERVNC